MNENLTANLKTLVRGAYDIQKLRISMGNRIVAQFKAKLGQAPSRSEDELDAEGKRILVDLRKRYRKITDGIKTFPRQTSFKGDELISSYTELCLLSQYLELEDAEKRHFKHLEQVLKEFPIYTQWLKDVKGIGPAMAGVIIAEIDITRAEYPSSLWKFAGIDTGPDGKGRSRRKEHLVRVKYLNKNKEEAERDSITFNPFLKTKLVGVLAGSIIKAGEGPYSKIYYDYKHRLENRPDWADTTKGHRHRAAVRYMIKMLLRDLYEVWRRLEGLPVAPPYSEAKLGIVHRKAG